MKRNILIFVGFMLCCETVIANEPQQQSPQLKVLWQKEFAPDKNRGYESRAVTFYVKNKRLLVLGTSYQPETSIEGKFWLWEIDENGNLIKSKIIRELPPSSKAAALPRSFFTSSLNLDGDQVVKATSKFSGGNEYSTIWMDRNSNDFVDKTIAKEAETEKYISFNKRIELDDDNSLLLGGDGHSNGLVIKLDSRGNRLWKKIYDHGHTEYFTDGLSIGDKGEFLVVGTSVESTSKLSIKLPSLIWIAKCDAKGIIVSEQTFTGNTFSLKMPKICRLGSNGFVVAYDKSVEMTRGTDLYTRAYSPDLKTLLWEKQVAKSEGGIPGFFRIKSLSDKGFVVAVKVDLDDVGVYEYDAAGNKKASFHCKQATFDILLESVNSKIFVFLNVFDVENRSRKIRAYCFRTQ